MAKRSAIERNENIAQSEVIDTLGQEDRGTYQVDVLGFAIEPIRSFNSPYSNAQEVVIGVVPKSPIQF